MSWARSWTIDPTSSVAEGNQGSVVRVHDSAGRSGALKRMKVEDLVRSERVARFRAEAATLDRLRVEGVPAVLDQGDDEYGAPYFVSRWIEGKTLANTVSGQPQPLPIALTWCKELAKILESVHAQGVVHRDVKPNNLVISEDGTLWLVDFGISWNSHAIDEQLTEVARSRIGNYFLILPEFYEEAEKRDRRSDVTLAVGIFFYLLTGRKPGQLRDSLAHSPHEREPAKTLLRDHLGSDLRSIRSIFDIGFAQTPPHRFQSATQFLSRLAQIGLTEAENLKDKDDLAAAKSSYLSARQAINASIDEIETKLVAAMRTISAHLGAAVEREGFEKVQPSATQVVLPGREVGTLWRMRQRGHEEPQIFYKVRACLTGEKHERLELRLTAQHRNISTLDRKYFEVPSADITGFLAAAENVIDEMLADAIRDLTRKIVG